MIAALIGVQMMMVTSAEKRFIFQPDHRVRAQVFAAQAAGGAAAQARLPGDAQRQPARRRGAAPSTAAARAACAACAAQHAPTSPFRAPPLHPFGDADAFGDAFEDAFRDGYGDTFGDAGAGDERLLEEVELRAASANFPRRHALALIRHDSDPAALPGRTSIRSFSAGAAKSKHVRSIMSMLCAFRDDDCAGASTSLTME